MSQQLIDNADHNAKVTAQIEKQIEKQGETMNVVFWAGVAIAGFTALVTIVTWAMHYPEYLPF